jgi:protein-S-isoprenylcysteine O-methyltransferase Ste14
MLEWYDYLQIATLILFFLLIAAKALHLLVTQQINPFAIGSGKDSLQKFIEICSSLVIVLWASLVLAFALHIEHGLPAFLRIELLNSSFAKLIGAILISCSLLTFASALISFGHSWRVGIDERAPGELVSRGVFAITRNPIFVSLIVYAVGSFLIHGRLILLIFAVLIAAGVHYQIIQEEKFLSRMYGAAYERYTARTGRYFSFRGWTRV